MADNTDSGTTTPRNRGYRGGRGAGNFRGRGGAGHHHHQQQHHRGGRGGGGQHHGQQGQGHGGEGGSGGNTRGDKVASFKKENILDLNKYLDREIRVKFTGGREAVGTLKGFDQLMNLVLDDVRETMRDDEGNVTTRPLGLAVFRGTVIALIHPMDGCEEIKNPFVTEEEAV